MESYLLMWITIFVLACIFEAMTQHLLSIWFAAGSLVCVFLSALGVELYLQLIVFIVVSSITLLAFRPIALKHAKQTKSPTNMDRNIGEVAVVLNDFDETTNEGRVMLEGMDWAAKSKESSLTKGDEVVILKIEGAKLIVSRKQGKKEIL